MPFNNTNFDYNMPKDDPFQAGVSNVDSNEAIEKDIKLPWVTDPLATWMYFDCAVSVTLDSGIVTHNRLPQVNNLPDSLASAFIDDPQLDGLTGLGVNLKSLDQYTDIQQRMAHSRYWFHIFGQALRVGHQIPIPKIKTIGGVTAIPHDNNPQWAFCRIFPGGNYCGGILWHAQWSLWYTTLTPPVSNVIPAADPSAHIRDTSVPTDVQAPYSLPDDNARTNSPIIQG